MVLLAHWRRNKREKTQQDDPVAELHGLFLSFHLSEAANSCSFHAVRPDERRMKAVHRSVALEGFIMGSVENDKKNAKMQ